MLAVGPCFDRLSMTKRPVTLKLVEAVTLSLSKLSP